jgi:hypothetical protein
VVQPRQRYLAGTARPAAPLDNGVADEPVNPADPVENADPDVSADVAVPAEQEAPLDVNCADVLEETANQPAPTGRGHRRRRPPASLSPGGDFVLPPSRRPRLEPNTATIRPAASSGTVRGRRGRGRETRSNPMCAVELLRWQHCVLSAKLTQGTLCFIHVASSFVTIVPLTSGKVMECVPTVMSTQNNLLM